MPDKNSDRKTLAQIKSGIREGSYSSFEDLLKDLQGSLEICASPTAASIARNPARGLTRTELCRFIEAFAKSTIRGIEISLLEASKHNPISMALPQERLQRIMGPLGFNPEDDGDKELLGIIGNLPGRRNGQAVVASESNGKAHPRNEATVAEIKSGIAAGIFVSFAQVLDALCVAEENIERVKKPTSQGGIGKSPRDKRISRETLGDWTELRSGGKYEADLVIFTLKKITKNTEPVSSYANMERGLLSAILSLLGFSHSDEKDKELIKQLFNLPGYAEITLRADLVKEKPSPSAKEASETSGKPKITKQEIFDGIRGGERYRGNFKKIGPDLSEATGIGYSKIGRIAHPNDKKAAEVLTSQLSQFFLLRDVKTRNTMERIMEPAARAWELSKEETELLIDLRLRYLTPATDHFNDLPPENRSSRKETRPRRR